MQPIARLLVDGLPQVLLYGMLILHPYKVRPDMLFPCITYRCILAYKLINYYYLTDLQREELHVTPWLVKCGVQTSYVYLTPNVKYRRCCNSTCGQAPCLVKPMLLSPALLSCLCLARTQPKSRTNCAMLAFLYGEGVWNEAISSIWSELSAPVHKILVVTSTAISLATVRYSIFCRIPHNSVEYLVYFLLKCCNFRKELVVLSLLGSTIGACMTSHC